LLSLVLSAQKRFSEAEVVTDAALDETSKWEQGPLFRLKAKLKIAELRPMDAIEIYRYLLALVQAQKKSSGPQTLSSQVRFCYLLFFLQFLCSIFNNRRYICFSP
jgi:hypothetical protein